MIKGCRKRMVIVSGLKDSDIETAYFVMKDSADCEILDDEDIVKKANSIIESSLSQTVEFKRKSDNDLEKAKNSVKYFIFFAMGIISGAAIVLLLELYLKMI